MGGKRKRSTKETPCRKSEFSENTTVDGEKSRELWSKSKKKRMRQRRAQQQQPTTEPIAPISTLTSKEQNQPSSSKNANGKLSLQEKFRAQLLGSRFRQLNEELYTTTSAVAFQRFSQKPELYEQYHEGFGYQVQSWPENPVDVLVDLVKTQFSAAKLKSPMVVADFGCGNAELAKGLLKFHKSGICPFRVHSFDLVASCDLVTACDMANVPLAAGSVDLAIFCLSLMGTNLADFIREAHRVLRSNGKLKIAEVRSRFEGSNELGDFLGVLKNLGFECERKDQRNKMFIILELRKNGKKPHRSLEFTAKPCIYKRR